MTCSIPNNEDTNVGSGSNMRINDENRENNLFVDKYNNKFDKINERKKSKDLSIYFQKNTKEELEEYRNGSTNKKNSFYLTPIILVDDEPDLLFTFSIMLKDEGYRNVKTFSDSRKAVSYFLESKDPNYYKLAIVDIMMPNINGIQLYQILKVLNPSVKIIFITSLDAVNEITNTHPEIKSKDIIKKPVEKDKFIELVNDKVFK